jgi:hypothetical protein
MFLLKRSTKLNLAQSKFSANVNSNPRSAHPFTLIAVLILLFSESTKLSLYRKWSQFDKAVEEQKVNNWDWKCNQAADISNPSGLDCKSSDCCAAKIPASTRRQAE